MKTKILSPKPYRVYQRGKEAEFRLLCDDRIRSCQVTVLDYKSGGPVAPAVNAVCTGGAGSYTASMPLPEGGWYTLVFDLEFSGGKESVKVGPVGCGEVFVVAGQSNATNSHCKQFKVTEPEGRVAVYDQFNDIWRVADDPQPCYDFCEYNKNFGSLWALTGDLLYEKLGVPIGFVNAAYGATASFQWLEGQELYSNLVHCCRAVENFRYILWQQGESDVMWHIPTEVYMNIVKSVKCALEGELGKSTEWLLAKSTIHPSVYNDPEHEALIYNALERLANECPGMRRGPDTDTLSGDNRDIESKVSGHMTEKGQKAAAGMWAELIAGMLS